MKEKLLAGGTLLMLVIMLSACGANTASQPVASPISLQSPPPFDSSLDDVSLDDPSSELEKIARNLDIHAGSSDTVPNFSQDLDSIEWDNIDQGLAEIQKQL